MQVKMISTQYGLIKNIPSGKVLSVRPVKNTYQVITGEFAGKYIEPKKCILVTSEEQISVSEWLEMEQGYLNIIKSLERDKTFLQEKCDNQEEELQKQNYFLETTANALHRICELKQEIEELKNG